MHYNSQDEAILEKGEKSRFWSLIASFAEEKKQALQAGILSWLSEERSKPKRNDRDLALAEVILIDELLAIPELIKNQIRNENEE